MAADAEKGDDSSSSSSSSSSGHNESMFDKVRGCVLKGVGCVAAVLFAGSCIGTIWTLILVDKEVSVAGEVSGRVSTMAEGDFESIEGGCIIVLTNKTKHYSMEFSTKVATNAGSTTVIEHACSDRVQYAFRVSADSEGVLYTAAPEDTLMYADKSCEMPQEFSSVRSNGVDQVVPCWRAVSDVTRNERLFDPRMTSYEGITYCGSKCASVVGYGCGDSACIKLRDPADERAFLADYASTSLPLYAGLAAGCLAVLVLACTAFIIDNKMCQWCPCKVCKEDEDSDEEEDETSSQGPENEGSQEEAPKKKKHSRTSTESPKKKKKDITQVVPVKFGGAEGDEAA